MRTRCRSRSISASCRACSPTGGVDVDALEFSFRAESDPYDANWKVIVENYLECYHCSVAHPSFSKAIDVGVDAYRLETRPTFSSQLAVARNGGGGVYDASGQVDRGQFHALFPSTLVNVMPGHANLSIGPVLPLGPERSTRYLDYFFAADVDEEWKREYLALDEVVGAEDRVLVERVQAGLRTRRAPARAPDAGERAADRTLPGARWSSLGRRRASDLRETIRPGLAPFVGEAAERHRGAAAKHVVGRTRPLVRDRIARLCGDVGAIRHADARAGTGRRAAGATTSAARLP